MQRRGPTPGAILLRAGLWDLRLPLDSAFYLAPHPSRPGAASRQCQSSGPFHAGDQVKGADETDLRQGVT